MKINSIFGKILASFIIIVIISFAILSVTLFTFLDNYAISEKEEVLLRAGEKISEMTNILVLDKYENVISYYQLSLDLISKNLDCDIILADNDGKIIAKTNNKNVISPYATLPKHMREQLVKGENVRELGKVDNVINYSVLTIAIPVKFENNVIAGVYLFTSTPELSRLRKDVFKMYLFCLMLSFFIAFVVIFFLSRKITDPINAVTKAAKSLTNGDFNSRVEEYKDDEAGQLAKSFNIMADSISRSEEMRRTFISDVSHELRTPMTTITGFVEGIIDETIPSEKQDIYLKIVLDESKRLSKLIGDLLDVSKLNSDAVLLETSVFDVNELIRLAIISFEKRFNEKKLRVDAIFEHETENVIADKDSIKRVIMNLLDNAIKFSYEKKDIVIKTYIKADKIYVSIKNYGIGISDASKKNIFERFYKSDKSRSQNKSGVGLGLHIVSSIIIKHNEKISVNSVENEYAEFIFTLQKEK